MTVTHSNAHVCPGTLEKIARSVSFLNLFLYYSFHNLLYIYFFLLECEPVDICWIIDDSGSIGLGNYQKQLTFIHDVTAALDLQVTKIAAITFADDALLIFDFKKFSERNDILNAIKGISYTSGRTHTAAGLQMAIDQVFTPQGGDRSTVQNMAIVITDGASNENSHKTIPTAKALQIHTALNVTVFAVPVGSVNQQEIKGIASSSSTIVKIESFDNIDLFKGMLLERTCSETSLFLQIYFLSSLM